MRTKQDNDINLYSLAELMAMLAQRQHPATKDNWCPFKLEEIKKEIDRREAI